MNLYQHHNTDAHIHTHAQILNKINKTATSK